MIKSLILLFCGLATLTGAKLHLPQEFDWESHVTLDEGVRVKWIGSDKEWLTMEMSMPSKGWIAVGFSPNGGMKGSDIVMGWVDEEGQAHIKDLHAVGNLTPLEDESQDYEILWGEQTDKGTSIIFRRKWNSCDSKHDNYLNMDTARLIWSWGHEDPIKEGFGQGQIFQPAYHGPDNRGVKSIHLRDAVNRIPFPDDINPAPGIKFWDILMNKNVVNDEDTTYFCKLYKAPHLDKKHQMIGFKAIVEPGNEEFVHHILMYECKIPEQLGGSEREFEQYLNHPGSRCFAENMPPSWGAYCLSVPVVWAVGHEGLMYPEHVGVPLGEKHGGVTYFLIEMHYDNQNRKSFVDSSGLRVYVTENLRPYDLNSLQVGQRFSPFNTIPEGASNFKTRGLCPGECTRKEFPKEGITAFQVFPHGHTIMKGLTIRHIRNGVELAPIVKDNSYDFDYQQTRILPKPVQIMPGDDLIVECDTSTIGKDKRPYFGGIQTREEMCISFIYYYSRMELGECRSDMEFNTYFNAMGIDKVEGEVLDRLKLPYVPEEGQYFDPPDVTLSLQNDTDRAQTYERGNIFDWVNIIEPKHLRGKTVGDIIADTKWTDDNEKILKEVNQKWLDGNYYAFCSHEGRVRVPLDNYIVKMPKFQPYIDPEETMCKLYYGQTKNRNMLRTSMDAGYYSSGIQFNAQMMAIGLFAALAYLSR